MAKIIDVIIPAHNEEKSIRKVINEIPANLVRNIIVVNNNSTDATKKAARSANLANCIVVDEKNYGYGYACLRGIFFVAKFKPAPDIIVFLDGDYSDYPAEMESLVSPILNENYDLVIGSRVLGKREAGSLLPQQILGNRLATSMIKFFYHFSYTDLGPFRAIRYVKLIQLKMQDKTFGWTVEMQIKAIKKKLKIKEVPVKYRKRIGRSKIAGTIKGTILAGYKIISTILIYSLKK